MAELRENRIKHKLANGELATVIGGYLTPDLIEFIGLLGFDGVWLEAEHGPVDFADIGNLTRACDLWGMTSVVRINLNLQGVIYRTLDQGAQGIVVPHVNTAAEARAVVDGAKFHPIGSRGMFTSRQGLGVDRYAEKANDETLVIVLIEDIEAVNHLSEIIEVDDIDVFFVAPGDLGQTMGYPGQYTHPKVVETVERTLDQIISSGRVAGALVNDSTVEAHISRGVRFLYNSWQPWITAAGNSYLEKVSAASLQKVR